MLFLIFGSKNGLGDDFGQYNTKTIILRRFLAKRLLEIALPWQHLRSQVIKHYFSPPVPSKMRFLCNFPFMSSNIPSAPAYGVYASQFIRYARCCSNYSDFFLSHRALVTRLLSQGYKVNRLSNTFKKFYGRHTDLVEQYNKNVCQMFADSIS